VVTGGGGGGGAGWAEARLGRSAASETPARLNRRTVRRLVFALLFITLLIL
jgi:hypothetical protein